MSRNLGWCDVVAYANTRHSARRFEVDILHGHGAKGGAYARLAARSLKKTGQRIFSFYTPHGGSLHYSPASLPGRVFTALERRLAVITDGFIFESDFARKAFECNIGLAQSQARVIANGLHTEEFEPVTASAAASDFLFIGELRHLKGVDVLLRALKRVTDRRLARVTITGDGRDSKSLSELANSLGIASLCTFTGTIPARTALTLGRILVVPSRAESLPYVVLEAIAAGVPVIATNVGGIPEITHESDMVLLPAGNDAALSDAMLKALDEEDEMRRRAVQLKKTVLKRYTVGAMTAAILEFYMSVRASQR